MSVRANEWQVSAVHPELPARPELSCERSSLRETALRKEGVLYIGPGLFLGEVHQATRDDPPRTSNWFASKSPARTAALPSLASSHAGEVMGGWGL